MHTLTDHQKTVLKHFVVYSLSNIIDEEISSEYLVSDELINTDNFDEINRIKTAAIEYIKSIL